MGLGFCHQYYKPRSSLSWTSALEKYLEVSFEAKKPIYLLLNSQGALKALESFVSWPMWNCFNAAVGAWSYRHRWKRGLIKSVTQVLFCGQLKIWLRPGQRVAVPPL